MVQFYHQPAHERGKEVDPADGLGIAHAGGADDADGANGLLGYAVLAEDYPIGMQGLFPVFAADVDHYFPGFRTRFRQLGEQPLHQHLLFHHFHQFSGQAGLGEFGLGQQL